MNATYRVVRFYQSTKYASEVLKRGLSLKDAHDHCRNKETSSRTCVKSEGTKRTAERGPWFDGYEEE